MTGIEVNISNLDVHIAEIRQQQETAQLLDGMTELETESKGLVADELVSYNEICNTLLQDLDILYRKVELFLSCTRDGIVTSDEYTAKLIENGISVENGGVTR